MDTRLQQLGEQGYQWCVVKIERLRDLQEEIESRKSLVYEEVVRGYLEHFAFTPPDELPAPQSIIVVAVRDPQVRFTFTVDGARIPLLAPPTYLRPLVSVQKVEKALEAILEPGGYRAVRKLLPAKLLAVRSGLASYGKNNITYITGMGSLYRLMSFYSDLPCEQDEWGEVRMLARCEHCLACFNNCPSGAISPDRFLLHTERCLAFYSEQPDVPTPEWLDPSWYNSLVGCFRCQEVCPENKEALALVEDGAEFSSEETALLLQGVPLDQLPPETAAKLERSGLDGIMDVLPRNLKILLTRW